MQEKLENSRYLKVEPMLESLKSSILMTVSNTNTKDVWKALVEIAILKHFRALSIVDVINRKPFFFKTQNVHHVQRWKRVQQTTPKQCTIVHFDKKLSFDNSFQFPIIFVNSSNKKEVEHLIIVCQNLIDLKLWI